MDFMDFLGLLFTAFLILAFWLVGSFINEVLHPKTPLPFDGDPRDYYGWATMADAERRAAEEEERRAEQERRAEEERRAKEEHNRKMLLTDAERRAKFAQMTDAERQSAQDEEVNKWGFFDVDQ